MIALGLSRFCDSQEGFNDTAMTETSRCFHLFHWYSRGGRLSPVGRCRNMSHNLLLEEVGPGEELPGFDIDDPILPREIAAMALRCGGYPLCRAHERKEYKRQELPLQVELVKLQPWVQKQRLVITRRAKAGPSPASCSI